MGIFDEFQYPRDQFSKSRSWVSETWVKSCSITCTANSETANSYGLRWCGLPIAAHVDMEGIHSCRTKQVLHFCYCWSVGWRSAQLPVNFLKPNSKQSLFQARRNTQCSCRTAI